jgi:putative peptidoglycan lipid II flippase
VFNFSGIFDSIAVPHLVRARENNGLKVALALARSIFWLSLLISAVTSIVFLGAIPLLAPIFATGFPLEERAQLAGLAWYFLPWTVISVPYYAVAARYKMEWRFNRVFIGEVIVVAVSIAFIGVWHGNIRMLPLAYASGYGVGLIQLVAGAGLWRRVTDAVSPSVRAVLRNIGEMFLANQAGSLASLVDRHMQSFIVPGGIGAINYSTQIVASLSSLLTFREIYVVPLTQQADRARRLERLLSGLLLLAVPLAGLVACFAPELVTILLQRGRFDATAAMLTTQALRISALSIVTGTVCLPMLRMFQILDRIRFTQALFLLSALEYAVFGYIFVMLLGLEVRGVAYMQIASSAVSAIVAAGLLSRCGIRPNWWQVLSPLLFALVVSGTASLVAILAVSGLENAWARLIGGGATYGVVILIFYFLARSQLRAIVLAAPPSWKLFLEV